LTSHLPRWPVMARRQSGFATQSRTRASAKGIRNQVYSRTFVARLTSKARPNRLSLGSICTGIALRPLYTRGALIAFQAGFLFVAFVPLRRLSTRAALIGLQAGFLFVAL